MPASEPPSQLLGTFEPCLDALPTAQRRFWPELSQTPEQFTLHGGTAIALRLGHRVSVDFDFFAPDPFVPDDLLRSVSYLRGGTVRQSAPNTLTVTIDRVDPVQVSFFGGLELGQVEPAERAVGPGIKVASLLDLSGFKVAVVPQRVELRDYIDVHTLLTRANIPLAKMLSAAKVIYGSQFNPLIALKTLAYFDEPALAGLQDDVRGDLIAAVKSTDLQHLPVLPVVRKGRD